MSIDNLVKSAQFMVDSHGTKKAVVLDMVAWEELLALLNDLTDTTAAEESYEEYQRDPSTARPWTEVEADMVAEGLLDEWPCLPWQVLVQRQAEKSLRRLDKPLRQRIRQAINQLAVTPRPQGCKKLAGYDNLYRVRVGDWRISYAIEDDKLIVLVVGIAPRGQVYRHL